jgi:hypothetical protein
VCSGGRVNHKNMKTCDGIDTHGITASQVWYTCKQALSNWSRVYTFLFTVEGRQSEKFSQYVVSSNCLALFVDNCRNSRPVTLKFRAYKSEVVAKL